MPDTNPEANWEEAISPGLSPAAAAIAAMLVGNWPVENPGAATITWPPKVVAMDVGAWVKTVCAWVPILLSVVEDWIVVGDGLKDGELVTVVTIGAVEMTDAVFVAPTVEPLRRKNELTLHLIIIMGD